MTWEEHSILKKEKKRNNRVKATYIHLHSANRHREKALLTFTVVGMSPKEKLSYVADIKQYIAKRFNNLNKNIKYFSVIELGKNFNNPHLHIQLYYDEDTKLNIVNVFEKTIAYFSLNEKRCKLTFENTKITTKSSCNYPIKEFNNTKLSDKQIIALYQARIALKRKENKYMRFYSYSRFFQPMVIYRRLYQRFQLGFMEVDKLFRTNILRKFSRQYFPRILNFGSKKNTSTYLPCGRHVVRVNREFILSIR